MKLNATTINIETLETIANQSIAKLETSNRTDAKRWINAIKKAVSELQSNCYWNYADGELLMMSETSNEIYTPNGKCGCKAFKQGFPCKHRASARLLERYSEAA